MNDPIDRGFAVALQVAGGENYLGDPAVVDTLLRRLVLFANDEATKAASGDAWAKAVNEHATELAAIFTGRNPQFTAVPAWNTDAQMLARMQTVGAVDVDAQDAVRSVLLRMVGEFFDTASAYADRADEAEAKEMLDMIFDRHAKLFLGT